MVGLVSLLLKCSINFFFEFAWNWSSVITGYNKGSLTYRIFAQFSSNWRKLVGGSSSKTLRFDTWNIDFVNIFFNFKKKIFAWIKTNPVKTYLISPKNQGFKLFTLRHFKNLISAKPRELPASRKLKQQRQRSTVHTSLIFQI